MFFTREYRQDWQDGYAHYEFIGPQMVQFEEGDLPVIIGEKPCEHIFEQGSPEDKLNRINFYTWMWLISLKPGNQNLEDVKWPLALILAIRKKVEKWT